MQHLKQSDIENHHMFVKWMKNNTEIVQDIWFFDEAHFYLNGMHVTGVAKTIIFTLKNLYMKMVKVRHITVPVILKFKGKMYPKFNQGKELIQRKSSFNKVARPNTPSDKLLTGCITHLMETFISVWPLHSPDLNPLDFCLWGHLKDLVYKPKPDL